MQPHALVKAQGVAGIQAPSGPVFLPQRAAGRASSREPGAHLNRPWASPLPGRSPGKSKLGLCKSNVLADFQPNATGTPFGRVSLVMRMPGRADDSIQQIMASAGEIILEDLIAFTTAGWSKIIACEPRRFHQVLMCLELLAIHISPPWLVARKIVEVITPFAQLDCVEYPGLVERGQRSFIFGMKGAASFDLHVRAP